MTTLVGSAPRQSQELRRSRARQRKHPVQQELSFRTWGGKRDGAGRKPKLGRAGVPHQARPNHRHYEPVHVTMRATRRIPSLRNQSVFRAIRRALARASRASFQVVHFSVQADHVHLMVEARDKTGLSRGMAGLAIRFARAVNRVLRRTGRVWSDRFHARALRSPREVRHGIVYVVMNWRKHVPGAHGFDPCSSAIWFDGWSAASSLTAGIGPYDEACAEPPVRPAATWLGANGWRRFGLIGTDERPRPG